MEPIINKELREFLEKTLNHFKIHNNLCFAFGDRQDWHTRKLTLSCSSYTDQISLSKEHYLLLLEISNIIKLIDNVEKLNNYLQSKRYFIGGKKELDVNVSLKTILNILEGKE